MRRHLFLLIILLLAAWCGNAQTMQGYEYWFDDGYGSKTAVTSSQPYVSFEADVSSLQAGLHYLNFRAQDVDGIWGALSRYIIYLTADSRGNSDMVAYEYWMDTDYSHRSSVKGSTVSSPFTVDVSNLQPGLHYFNFRAQCSDGHWGAMSRYIVYISDVPASSNLAAVDYWIDSNPTKIQRQQVTDNTIVISADISKLPKGMHTFYVEGIASDGSRGMLNGYEFEVEAGDVEPYAALSENNTVLTFYCDDQKAIRDGMGIGPFDDSNARGWKDACQSITTVVFDESFANCTSITSTARWFDGCSNLTSISGINNLYTANVTSMRRMFKDCSSLTSIDVSHFNTENVTNMEYMFDGCSGLTILDVSGFNTENVTNMGSMFASCSGLTTLDVTDFNTANVTDISRMFYSCSGLTTLDLSNFNTANAKEDMRHLFMNCFSLKTIYAGSGWTTDATTKGDEMFMNCTSLVGGAGTVYDENHTDHTYAHIDGGTSNPGYFTDKNAPVVTDPEPYAVLSENNTVLTFYYDTEKEERNGMDVGPFYARNNYDISSGWFEHRESITNAVFDESFANCTTITNTDLWFYLCNKLTTITGLGNLKTDNVTSMWRMFDGCSSLTSLDVSGFNTSNVTNMQSMFEDCSSLTSLDVSHFNTSNVTNMFVMFRGCSSLTSLDVTNFDTSNVRDMHGMFDGLSTLTSLDISHFDTGNVTEIGEMFRDCKNLTSIDVSNFNTSNVTEMWGVFEGCQSLTSIDISNFNTESLTDMQHMFYKCSNLVSVNLSSFNTSKVTKFENIFRDCTSLAAIHVGNAEIPAEEYAKIGNPNLLLYVNEARVAPEGVQNVVVNGVAKEIVLTDNPDGKIVNNNWYCPEPFRAEKISYTREFRQQTQIGISRGWESLALPFAVQTITHQDKGAIAPFGSDASGLHFWLRRLGHEGLISVQMIEPNTPYIISMPNSEDYAERFNLNGRVTFAAEDAYVERTEQMEDESADYMMVPTFQRMPVSEYVYALNVGEERNGRPEGSIFERNYREVRPFEAYTLHRGDQPAPLFFDLSDLEGSTTDIPDVRWMMDDGNGEWYDLQGRKLGSTLNVQRSTLKKGVYIYNGRKTVVK